jgi:hypothetical protein
MLKVRSQLANTAKIFNFVSTTKIPLFFRRLASVVKKCRERNHAKAAVSVVSTTAA